MNFKKITALLLALMMLLSFAACDSSESKDSDDKKDNNKPSQSVEDPTPETTAPEVTEPDAEVLPLETLSMTMTQEDGSSVSLIVYPNYDGTVHLDYVGDTVKRADLDESVMALISEAFAKSGLSALADRYDEYNAVCGSFAASTADGTYIGGEVYAETMDTLPAEFLTGYYVVDGCFLALMEDVPEYVPEPVIIGEIAEGDMAAIDAILDGMQIENIDAFAITGVVKDEFFATTMGLSSDAGIASGVQLVPMMMSQAYALNIVTLEDGTDASAVAADFEANIDWMKWVCVSPDQAMIAVKGNQVLILLGQADLYTTSAAAIEAAGWTTTTTLTNPSYVG